MEEINIAQAYELVTDILYAGLVPNLLGSPGIGKSDIIKQIANDQNLQLIDFRLAQADPTDLSGFPSVNKETGRSFYAPPDTFPLEGDPIPEGKQGWLIFFDEANAAADAVQVAAYKVLLDRMVGQKKLHSKVAMVLAGNLSTDKAIVNRLSTAMQSRLIHLNLSVTTKEWIDWAYTNNIDHRIIAFLKFRPELLHKFNPKHADNTFPCPRTWHFLSKLITGVSNLSEDKFPLLIGTIGEGTAYEFAGFSKIYLELPSLEDILVNPESIHVSQEPSTQYAISSMLGVNAKATNIDTLMKFITRLPIEFQIITLQGIMKINNKLVHTASIKEWIKVNAKELI